MHFTLSGSSNTNIKGSFVPGSGTEVSADYGVYVQTLHDLISNSVGINSYSRNFSRLKITNGSIRITLSIEYGLSTDFERFWGSYFTLCSGVMYGRSVPPSLNSYGVYDQADWKFDHRYISYDKQGNQIPYVSTIVIPVKTGWTTFSKLFGNKYQFLLGLGLVAVLGKITSYEALEHRPIFHFTTSWNFNCVGEGPPSGAMSYLPCMIYIYSLFS